MENKWVNKSKHILLKLQSALKPQMMRVWVLELFVVAAVQLAVVISGRVTVSHYIRIRCNQE
jgi:hypothetical protein